MPRPEQLQELCGDLEDLAKKIARIIEDQGAVNLSPDLLRSIASEMYDKAFAEAHLRFEQQRNGPAPPWEALFHDDNAPGRNGIRAGDRKKTMSPPLGPDSMIVRFMNEVLQVLAPGYKVALDPNGGHHIVLIHHDSEELFSGEDYVQAYHTDMPLHGSGQHFSNRTLPACLREDGPLVFWLTFSKTPIGLAYFKRSHHVVRIAGQFYIHYRPLWAEYSRTHAGAKEEDFKHIWADLVLRHVREECERLDIQVEPEAILNSVPPGGGALWHSLTVHGGTSQGGLRAFAIVLKDKDQNTVELPQKAIEIAGTSRVLAGAMQIYRPPTIALTNKFAAEQIAKIIDHNSRGLRAVSFALETAVLHVLDGVRSDLGVRPVPAHPKVPAQNVRSGLGVGLDKITFRHSHSLLGLVCSIVSRELGAGKVLLWLEHNDSAQDPTRAILVRNAAFTSAMNQLQRRRVSTPDTVCRLVLPRASVSTFMFDTFSLLCSPVFIDRDGEMLQDRMARVLVPWNELRELTEPLRDTLSEFLKTVDRLENDGFRMVVIDIGLFYVTGDGRVILVFFGGGFLGRKKQALCDRIQPQEVTATPLLRRCTSTYLTEFLESSKDRADCNMKRMLKLVLEHERVALAATVAADEAADAEAVAPTLQQWSDSDLRSWQSAGVAQKGQRRAEQLPITRLACSQQLSNGCLRRSFRPA